MTALNRPRGPLPARVYWTRRILVLASALALVLGVGSLLTRGSDGSGGGGTAVQAGAAESSGASSAAPTADTGKKRKKSKKSKKPSATPLPQPSGPCAVSDVVVTPIVADPVAGSDIKLRFEVTTSVSPACTWRVSPDTLTLKITSGPDEIWSSRECPAAIPTRDLVVRKVKPARFSMKWSARRSDAGCRQDTAWALPGWYHLNVAPLAGEPQELKFKLVLPTSETRTASPSPDQGGSGPTAEPVPGGKSRSAQPTRSPSGAVEPSG